MSEFLHIQILSSCNLLFTYEKFLDFWFIKRKKYIDGPFCAESIQKTDLKIKAFFKFACWHAKVSTHHSLQPQLLFSCFIF